MLRRGLVAMAAILLGGLEFASGSTGIPACDTGGTFASVSDAPTLIQAIQATDPGGCVRITDTISMTPGGLGTSKYTFGSGSKHVYLSAFSTVSVIFDITDMNVTFNNITIGNGASIATNTPGCIYADRSRLLFDQSSIKYCTSTATGGGVKLTNSTMIMTGANATLDGNAAVGGYGSAAYLDAGSELRMLDGAKALNNYGANYGGALFATGRSSIIIKNGTLHGNTADANGGVAFVEDNSVLSIQHSEVSENIASTSGGVAYVQSGGLFKALHCTISDNEASSNGAVVYMDGSFSTTGQVASGSIALSSVTGNTASQTGADAGVGYLTSAASLTVSDSDFDGNEAVNEGGCFFVLSSYLYLIDSRFFNQDAAKGGVFSTEAGVVHVSGCELFDNTATEAAGFNARMAASVYINTTTASNHGAVYGAAFMLAQAYSSVFVDQCQITGGYFHERNNITHGGAFFVQSSFLTITNSDLSNNQATNGGAIKAVSSSRLSVTNVTMANNRAGSDGGSVFLGSSTAAFRDMVVRGGHAGEGGGALFIQGKTTNVTVYNSLFDGNNASVGGAIHAASMDSMTSNNNAFTNNTASVSGGALKVAGGATTDPLMFENNSFYNNQVDFKADDICLTLILETLDGAGWDGAYVYVFALDDYDSSVDVSTTTNYLHRKTLSDGYSATHQICLSPNIGESEYVFVADLGDSSSDASGLFWTLEGVLFDEGMPVVHDQIDMQRYDTCTGAGGGSVHVRPGSVVHFTGCAFDESYAYNGNGGALLIESTAIDTTTAHISHTTFGKGAGKGFYGSQIYNGLSDVYVTNTYVPANGDGPTSQDGTMFNAGGTYTCISSAGQGFYGDCAAVDDCYSCVLNVAKPCSPGSYLSDTGAVDSSECLAASSGFYTNVTAALAAFVCPAGSYVTDSPPDDDGVGTTTGVSTGGRFCNLCPANTYSASDLSTGCTQCKKSRTSRPGATNCTLCKELYYYDPDAEDCLACPDGAICNGIGNTRANLKMEDGIFRLSPQSLVLRECPLAEGCKGGRNGSSWGVALCAKGYTGPLCRVCEDDYFFDAKSAECLECAGNVLTSETYAAITVVGVIFLVAVGAAVWRLTHGGAPQQLDTESFDDVQGKAQEMMVRKSIETMDKFTGGSATKAIAVEVAFMARFAGFGHKAKMLISFFQLATTSSFNLNVAFPASFNHLNAHFKGAVNLHLLEMIPLHCASSRENYAYELVGMTLMPIVIVLFICAVWGVAKCKGWSFNGLQYVLILLHLVYPSVSSQVLNSFIVDDDFGDVGPTSLGLESSFMAVDYSIATTSKTYKFVFAYAVVMVFVYPLGIVAFYAVLLYANKSELSPRHNADIDLNKRPKHLKFLYGAYAAELYWFEIFETLRRLALSGGLVVWGNGTIMQVVASVLICLLSIKMYTYFQPFESRSDNLMQEVAQYQLFFVLFTALLIQATTAEGGGGDGAGALLIAVSLVGPVIAIVAQYVSEEGEGAEKEGEGPTQEEEEATEAPAAEVEMVPVAEEKEEEEEARMVVATEEVPTDEPESSVEMIQNFIFGKDTGPASTL